MWVLDYYLHCSLWDNLPMGNRCKELCTTNNFVLLTIKQVYFIQTNIRIFDTITKEYSNTTNH